MKRFYKFLFLFFFLGFFNYEEIKAENTQLRLLCKPLAYSLKEEKNYFNFPTVENHQIYQINFSSNNVVSDVKIIDKFNTASHYQDNEYINKLGWYPTVDVTKLAHKMYDSDLKEQKRNLK